MADAYICDSCNDFVEGYPAVDFDIDARSRRLGGDVVLAEGITAGWPHGGIRVELCPSCAVDVIEWVGRYTSDYTERPSEI